MLNWIRRATQHGPIETRMKRRSRRSLGTLESLESRTLLNATQLLNINNATLDPAEIVYASTASGPRYFFTTHDPSGGTNLYVTQVPGSGAATGTLLLHSFPVSTRGNSTDPPASAANLTVLGNTVYFLGEDSANGAELWKSDGTVAGTQILKDINPGSGGSNPSSLTVWNNSLYFTANNGTTGTELWRSNGTAAGTVQAADIFTGANQGSSPLFLTPVGNRLVFAAQAVSGVDSDFRLYGFDGTTATMLDSDGNSANGVQSIKVQVESSVVPDSAFFVTGSTDYAGSPRFAAAGGKAYVVSADSSGNQQLWATDGTSAGTTLVNTFASGVTPAYAQPVSNSSFTGAVFLTLTGSTWDIWRSNGMSAGTFKLATLANSGVQPNANTIVSAGSRMYLLLPSSTDDSYQLWTSDGSASGTKNLGSVGYSIAADPLYQPQYTTMAGLNGNVYLAASGNGAGSELWGTNGTIAPVLVKDVNPGAASSTPRDLHAVNGQIFFGASGTQTTAQLWASDGTTAGTRSLLELPTQSSSPDLGIEYGNLTIFRANDGVTGSELWRSDGTPAGTYRLADITADGSSYPENLTLFNGLVYFTVGGTASTAGIWRTDGTAAGTVQVASIASSDSFNNSLAVYNGRLFYASRNSAGYAELHMSNGTPGSSGASQLLRTFATTAAVKELTVAGNRLFFTAESAASNREVWSLTVDSNGNNPTFTTLDINTAGSSNPNSLTAYNNRLYFVANGNYAGSYSGDEIWSTDGTTPVLLANIASGNGSSSPANLTVAANLLFFTASATPLNGTQLWATNGTVTQPANQFVGGRAPVTLNPTELVAFDANTLLYTGSTTATGRELFRFDLTNGEQLVKDVNPGTADGFDAGVFPVVVSGSEMYFPARTAATGNELWVTDGVAGGAGTQLFADILPGAASSNPVLLGSAYLGVLVGAGGAYPGLSTASTAGDNELYYAYQPVAPVFSAAPSPVTELNHNVQFQVSATDANRGQSVTYSLVSAPSGATINAGTGVVSWTPTTYANGSFKIRATDNDSPALSSTVDVTVQVVATNNAPNLDPPGYLEVTIGQPITFTVNRSDPDGNAVTLSAANLPAGATFNPATGSFSWTPTSLSDAFRFQFTATDNAVVSKSTTRETVVKVLPVKVASVSAPVYVNIKRTRTTKASQTTTITVNFTGNLNPADASKLANYQLALPGRDKKYGTKDDQKLKIPKVTYDATTRSVKLIFNGKLNFKGTARLLMNNLRDAWGNAVDGDRNGTPGPAPYAYVTAKAFVSMSSATVSAASVDALSIAGSLPLVSTTKARSK